MRKSAAAIGFIVATLIAALDCGALAAPKIGVASAVQNEVQGFLGPTPRTLSTGSDVFTNERIRTGQSSTAQLLFLDKTTLTMGPRAELTLDRFVYNPSRGTGQVVLNTVQGAFRFVTGSQRPQDYTIRTPVGVIGVRGTIGDLIVARSRVTMILVEGALIMTMNGVTYTLNVPGTSYTFHANGTVQGPTTWNGSLINASSAVSFPLYGWYFQGELEDNRLPNINLDNIDQLNGIISRGMPKPCRNYYSCGGGGGID